MMWEGSEVILLKWSQYLYHMSGVFKRKLRATHAAFEPAEAVLISLVPFFSVSVLLDESDLSPERALYIPMNASHRRFSDHFCFRKTQ